MSNIRCKLGIHDWNRYGEMVAGYSNLTQFRSCKRCNIIGYTRTYGDQANISDVNRTAGDSSEPPITNGEED